MTVETNDIARAIEWLYPGETLNPAQIRRDPQIGALAKRFAKARAEAFEEAAKLLDEAATDPMEPASYCGDMRIAAGMVRALAARSRTP